MRSMVAISAFAISGLKAFRRSGAFRVTTATPSTMSRRISSIAAVSPGTG
jgi:hypothetical protein